MYFAQITLSCLFISIVLPLLIAMTPPMIGRAIVMAGLIATTATLVLSLAMFVKQGERGFLSDSQAVLTGSLFLMISLLACKSINKRMMNES